MHFSGGAILWLISTALSSVAYLGEQPCLLPHIGDLFTVAQLRQVTGLVVHQAPRVLPRTAQGPQVELAVCRVAP